MADEVTNTALLTALQTMGNGLQQQITSLSNGQSTLLGHMEVMKNDLQQQIVSLVDGQSILLGHMQAMKLELNQKMDRGFADVRRELLNIRTDQQDCRLHREALEQDLNATMLTVARHDKKLSRR